jgi:hypothetical protein
MERTKTPKLIFKSVKSSQIKEIAYDGPSETLYVKFKNGEKVYSYNPVKKETHAELMASESVGKYYHANVRKAVEGKAVNTK